MKLFYIAVLTGFLALTACDLDETCTGTYSAIFSIGTDVTNDFNVASVSSSGRVLSSECAAVPEGTTVSATISNVTRSGNTLTVRTSEGSESVALSGNTVPAFTRVEEFSGCEFTAVLEGVLVASNNTIELSGSFSAQGLTCSDPF